MRAESTGRRRAQRIAEMVNVQRSSESAAGTFVIGDETSAVPVITYNPAVSRDLMALVATLRTSSPIISVQRFLKIRRAASPCTSRRPISRRCSWDLNLPRELILQVRSILRGHDAGLARWHAGLSARIRADLRAGDLLQPPRRPVAGSVDSSGQSSSTRTEEGDEAVGESRRGAGFSSRDLQLSERIALSFRPRSAPTRR